MLIIWHVVVLELCPDPTTATQVPQLTGPATFPNLDERMVRYGSARRLVDGVTGAEDFTKRLPFSPFSVITAVGPSVGKRHQAVKPIRPSSGPAALLAQQCFDLLRKLVMYACKVEEGMTCIVWQSSVKWPPAWHHSDAIFEGKVSGLPFWEAIEGAGLRVNNELWQ